MATYRRCRHCAANRCSKYRHWHLWCRMCHRPRVFRGPSCRQCLDQARQLVADLL